MSALDEQHLRRAIALAHEAAARGDRPYGAVLVDPGGRALLEASNTQLTTADPTGHAELNLVRAAAARLGQSVLVGATVYASGEPCSMCAGALYWTGVGRLVYALGADAIYALAGDPPDALRLGCREVLARGGRPVEVVGPLLEAEAAGAFGGS
jgi:tRNA(Arg) A34 adenosine deaminase TadA